MKIDAYWFTSSMFGILSPINEREFIFNTFNSLPFRTAKRQDVYHTHSKYDLARCQCAFFLYAISCTCGSYPFLSRVVEN